MKTYRVKENGITHKGIYDEAAKPYVVGDKIDLSDKDAELLKDFLAGEEEKIDMGELIPVSKLDAELISIKSNYEKKLRKQMEEKNAKLESKDEEIFALKGLLAKAEDEIADIKKELTTTKGLLTKANNKFNDIEKSNKK